MYLNANNIVSILLNDFTENKANGANGGKHFFLIIFLGVILAINYN